MEKTADKWSAGDQEELKEKMKGMNSDETSAITMNLRKLTPQQAEALAKAAETQELVAAAASKAAEGKTMELGIQDAAAFQKMLQHTPLIDMNYVINLIEL